MPLSRDDILKAADIVTEEVAVPEWGGEVLVRGLTGAERDAFEQSVMEQRGDRVTRNISNVHAKLAAWSCVDAGGNRLFSDADLMALGGKSGAALDRVFEVASRLSGLSREDLEDLGKGSASGLSEGSGSISPNGSAAPSPSFSGGSAAPS